MDINKSLKNNLGILLKSKNNNTISKNKKFVQSFSILKQILVIKPQLLIVLIKIYLNLKKINLY